MTSNELGDPEPPDRPRPEAGEADRASSDTPPRAEKASQPESARGRPDTERTAPETLSRDDYGDKLRGEGEPVPAADTSRAGDVQAADTESPAGRAGEDGGAGDRAEPYERAEPHGREPYADDMRAGQADPAPDSLVTGYEHGPEPFREAMTAGASGTEAQPPEPRSRDEYGDTIRAGTFDDAGQPGTIPVADPGGPADEWAGATVAGPEAGPLPAEPPPGAAADGGNAAYPEPGPDAVSGQPDRAPAPTGETAAAAERPAPGAASQPHADNPADQIETGEPGADPASPEQITHYHSEFKSQPVDLYTDGSRWVSGDRVAGQESAGPSPEGISAPLPAADRFPGPQIPAGGEDAETAPGNAYVQGKEVEVTRHADDGIWVGGLPGEMPGTPYGDPYGSAKVGDVLASTDRSEKSVADRLGEAFLDRAGEILDTTEKYTNAAQRILQPGPTHAEVPLPAAQAGTDTPYHEIDAGSLATAVMALGLTAWGIHHIWQQRHDRQQEREANRDGSH
jgi:hypothetical protein